MLRFDPYHATCEEREALTYLERGIIKAFGAIEGESVENRFYSILQEALANYAPAYREQLQFHEFLEDSDLALRRAAMLRGGRRRGHRYFSNFYVSDPQNWETSKPRRGMPRKRRAAPVSESAMEIKRRAANTMQLLLEPTLRLFGESYCPPYVPYAHDVTNGQTSCVDVAAWRRQLEGLKNKPDIETAFLNGTHEFPASSHYRANQILQLLPDLEGFLKSKNEAAA